MHTAVNAAREILDIMLHHLGYSCEISVADDDSVPGLLVRTSDSKAADALVGKHGDRLEDLQFLVNKLLRQKMPDAPRVRVDVNEFRARRDDHFLHDVRRLADRVRDSGRALKLDPLNSYQRRLVHNLLKDDPDVRTWSPEDDSRMKRITLLPRRPSPAAGAPS